MPPLPVENFVSWPKPKMAFGPYNIEMNYTARNLLGDNVDIMNALWYLEYYCTRYNCNGFRITKRWCQS